MKASKSIRDVLKNTFLVLETNSILEKPNKWENFKVIEKDFSGLTIGIGINEDNSSIKIFMIKDFPVYEFYDERKYKPTFKIGIPEGCGKIDYWRIEFEDEPINVNAGNPQRIYKHLSAVTEILEIITIISHSAVIS